MPVNNWGSGLAPERSRSPAAAQLDSDATLWLIVAAAGFFVGTMFITGPLAWYQANKLGDAYRALGMEPSSNANAARVIGMVSTIVGVIVLVAVCAVAMVAAALVIRQHH